MSLLELYKGYNSTSFYDVYCSTSSLKLGKIFCFINTNYRAILGQKGSNLTGFARGFEVLSEIEGIPRENWIRHSNSQEKEKQHVVNMRKSELFMVDGSTYHKTKKGIVFKRALQNPILTLEEKRLITYLVIVSGYFNNIPNYIFKRTDEIFQYFKEAGITETKVMEISCDFIRKAKETNSIIELLSHPYIYLDSFAIPYGENNFLKDFYSASQAEKEELYSYITRNYTIRNLNCVISNKFQPGGMYVKNTVLDNAWILTLSRKINNVSPATFNEFIELILNYYNEIFPINKNRVEEFILNPENKSVFYVIYNKLYQIVQYNNSYKELTEEEIQSLGVIDSTDEDGQLRLEEVNQSLAKLCKLRNNYKCDFEEFEDCKYFTAKSSNENYLEVHHFIPREFANDFDNSIEVLENYVALCPNCHRKIHHAVDNERKHMLRCLVNRRKEQLASKKLPIDFDIIFSYYGIE